MSYYLQCGNLAILWHYQYVLAKLFPFWHLPKQNCQTKKRLVPITFVSALTACQVATLRRLRLTVTLNYVGNLILQIVCLHLLNSAQTESFLAAAIFCNT